MITETYKGYSIETDLYVHDNITRAIVTKDKKIRAVIEGSNIEAVKTEAQDVIDTVIKEHALEDFIQKTAVAALLLMIPFMCFALYIAGIQP